MATDKRCAFGACDRPVSAKGLCSTHYGQQRAGKELTPIRAYDTPNAEDRTPTARPPRERRTCSVEGCDKTHRAKGYCEGHYMQLQRGKPTTN